MKGLAWILGADEAPSAWKGSRDSRVHSPKGQFVPSRHGLLHGSLEAGLTTEPHDEHHLRSDFMVTEEIQEVGEGENVHRSTKQHKHLRRATERSDRETSGPSGLSR